MRNVTKFLAAGASAVALSAGLLLSGGVSASAAPAATATSQAAEFHFKGATVLAVTSKKLTLLLTSGSTVDVTIGKNTKIEGNLAVGGKAEVKGISVAGSLLASVVIGR